MTDKELLELAAKVAGIEIAKWDSHDSPLIRYDVAINIPWNPLTDDGDALRLAVKMRLRIEVNETSIVVESLLNGKEIYEYPKHGQNKDYGIVYTGYEAATRRAIVRAAAEIGKGMK